MATLMSKQKLCFDVAIIGAGSAGLSLGASLRRALPSSISIGLIDGSKYHYYQPSWTLAAIRKASIERNRRPIKSLIPRNVDLIESHADSISPSSNSISLKDGQQVAYKILVVCCGIEPNYSSIIGLKEALDNDDEVFTIFDIDYRHKPFPAISSFSASKDRPAIFTYPANELFKCRGAACKIMFLSHDLFLKNGIRNPQTIFVSPKNYLFSVQHYNKPLEQIAKERHIELMYGKEFRRIDSENKTIFVKDVQSGGEEVPMKYGMLHVTPEMQCPPVVRNSPDLIDEQSFVSVDPYTLRHTRFNNVFALGDACNAPTSKTAAAVADQLRAVCPAIVKDLVSSENKSEVPKYAGYTACPIYTGSNKVLLAEFDYDKKPTGTFPFDETKSRHSMYLVKRYIMPWLYWSLFLRGLWHGPFRLRRVLYGLRMKTIK